MIKTSEFIERREKILANLEDNSILILFSGVAKKRSSDESYDFFCNRNFYYLTNILQEDSAYMAIKNNGVIDEFLFIQPYNELKEKWTGRLLRNEEASQLSGIRNVLSIGDPFESEVFSILGGISSKYSEVSNVYLDLDKEQKIAKYGTVEDFANLIQAKFTNLVVRDVYGKLVDLRMVKSPAEIEEFKEAVAKTNMALKRVMKAIKPGLYEYQLSSLFYYAIQDYDYSELSFPTICASGVNATTLHYCTPTSKLKKDDLILFDLGAKHHGYCADISRTYPISGKFSPLQAKIYQIVLDCNKMVIEIVKPGLTIADIQKKVVDFLAQGCLDAGLIRNKEDIKNYYFHNISHHIGLDTHDISDRNRPLVAGNIISDEPGLYFKELGIGVRIEDDILVTEQGCYDLSSAIIKEIKDIERAMGSTNAKEN